MKQAFKVSKHINDIFFSDLLMLMLRYASKEDRQKDSLSLFFCPNQANSVNRTWGYHGEPMQKMDLEQKAAASD